jgi:L,D-transpeptidase catalytic domain
MSKKNSLATTGTSVLARHQPRAVVPVGLLLSIFLLNACSGAILNNQAKGTATTAQVVAVTPAVVIILHNEGDAELQTFQQWIALMQQFNGGVVTYQQQYTSDKHALQGASSDAAYKTALTTLRAHVSAIQLPAMKAESTYLFQELQKDASTFGKKHTFHDSYNSTTYPLGYNYGPNGAGSSLWLKGELASARTPLDYQQAIEDLNMNLTNFHAMVADSSDKTPYNKVHKTDIKLMQHYQFMQSKVVVVSLAEQALRVYSHGKLVNSFQVTTGQPDLPTPPGTWWVEGKKAPTEFKADVPRSSPNWYPPTPINFAMQFHSNGYFLHDSWWRSQYGPGTNFPHLDPGGTQYSIHGSHGCVNMSKDNAGWLYKFVSLYTHILIY